MDLNNNGKDDFEELKSFAAGIGSALSNLASSVGAAVAQGFSVIVASFLPEQRQILADVKAKFNADLNANIAAGMGTLDAIEAAGTSAWNTFCNEEGAYFQQEASATITLLVSAAKAKAGHALPPPAA